jgi:hypothetical protein
MKPVDSRIRAVLISLLAASALSASPRAVDRVRIISVNPESVTRGVPVELTVVAEGDLESLPSGLIQLGFNDSDLSGFHMVDRKEIGHGVSRVELKRMVVPVDWGKDGDFTVMVNIGGPSSNPWQPLAADKRKLVVAVHAAASRDSIRITSVSPADSVTRGVPQTFHVEVGAALHSLDGAVVMIGFNTESPLKWTTPFSQQQRVHAGHRHLTFNVRAIPVDWGMAGSFGVRVFLGGEPPQRPIAGDTRTIPVRP